MPAMDDDDRPKKKIVHEIGQDLTLLAALTMTCPAGPKWRWRAFGEKLIQMLSAC